MMDETDPSGHNPICHNHQPGPDFPEVARCWCQAEQGSDGTIACCGGHSPSPGTPRKLETALPHGCPPSRGWCLMQRQ